MYFILNIDARGRDRYRDPVIMFLVCSCTQ